MPELGEPISERELDVLNCLVEGASNREIADQLSISHNTVKVHLRNIFTKLGVSSRTEATTVALQKGMLSIPGMETEAAQEAEDAVAGEEGDAGQPAPVVETGTAQYAGSRFSRRQLSILIGLLTVLLLAVAVNGLMSRNREPAATGTAVEEPTVPLFEETAINDNWVMSRALPEARARMALATVGLNLYAIGGENGEGVDNAVLIFDSQQRVWRRGAPKLTAVASAAAGVLAGEIYVAGGYGENGLPTTAVEAYSPLNDAWRPVTALPQRVAGAVAIANNGLLYLFGGEDEEGALAAAFVYDPGEQRWATLTPMQEARTLAVGGVLGDKLYVVGGRDGNQTLATCEAYDPLSATWTSCPPLQEARAAASSAVFLNKLYVLGGDVAAGNAAGEVYDAAEESWTTFEVPMLSEAEDWPYLGVANVETHIYAVGGEREGRLSDALYVYRPFAYQFFIPAASAGGSE